MSEDEFRIEPDHPVSRGRMGMHIEVMGPFVDMVMNTGDAIVHLPMSPDLARRLARDLIRSAKEAERNE